MEVNVGGSRIDPAARSVDERIHRRKDLVDLDDEPGLFLKDFDQLTSFRVHHFRFHVGDGQDDSVTWTDQVDLNDQSCLRIGTALMELL